MSFDFDRDMEPPDWLVDGVLERGTVTLLSGDTAAGKSLIADALTVAVLKGTEWLGRDVQEGRVLYVDEENHRRLVRDRLKAFGLSNRERDGLRYYLRAGIALGDDEWNRWLSAETQDHRADLVVIDTASSTTSHDVNDNSKVAQLFRDALRPATLTGAAVLVLHHERKTGGEGVRNASQAMLGARQWAGQADGHLAIRATGALSNSPDDVDGCTRQRYPVEIETPKVRDGQPALPERLTIASERDADNRLVSMWLEGDADPRVAGIVSFLSDRETAQRREIGKALGLESTDGRLERALKAALADGKVIKVARGSYAAA